MSDATPNGKDKAPATGPFAAASSSVEAIEIEDNDMLMVDVSPS